MFELMLCSLFTLVPDYLYRRYGQGKRIGKEITLFSMWYELRWGITGCVMLTVLLITMIFYYHPSTSSAALFFRTVPVAPEIPGRVAEVNVDFSAPVKKGTVLAVEGFEGTDKCLARGGELAGKDGGGIAVKVAKIDHDMRFDIPCIGPQTLEACSNSGISVLALEAGKTLLLERETCERLAVKNKISLTTIG